MQRLPLTLVACTGLFQNGRLISKVPSGLPEDETDFSGTNQQAATSMQEEPTKQDEPITVGEHQLGETFDVWLSKSDPSIESICEGHHTALRKKTVSAKCISEVSSSGEGSITQYDGKYVFQVTVFRNWHFSNHKLTQIDILYTQPDTAQQIKWLTEKYGPITKSDVTKYHNGFGAQWECLNAMWITPGGGMIGAVEILGAGNKVQLLVSFRSHEAASKILTNPGKPNPY
jgi:hypothetical protein